MPQPVVLTAPVTVGPGEGGFFLVGYGREKASVPGIF